LISLSEPESEALLAELPDAYTIGRATARGRKPIEVHA
jgi:hypothetical protein